MIETLAQIRERLFQQRAARHDAVVKLVSAAQRATAVQLGTHVAGDRVFDVVSGQEGTVLHGTRENIIGPAAER